AEDEGERLRLQRVVFDQHQPPGRLVLTEAGWRGRHASFTRSSYDFHAPRLKEARPGPLRTCRQTAFRRGEGSGRFKLSLEQLSRWSAIGGGKCGGPRG